MSLARGSHGRSCVLGVKNLEDPAVGVKNTTWTRHVNFAGKENSREKATLNEEDLLDHGVPGNY
jgi:hypothetical protein